MSERGKGPEAPELFDLPLQGGERGGGEPAEGGPVEAEPRPRPRRRAPRPPAEEEALPLFPETEPGSEAEPEGATPAEEWSAPASAPHRAPPAPAVEAPPPPRPHPVPAPAPAPEPPLVRALAPFQPRLKAAAVDAGVHLAAGGLGAAAALLLGVPLAVGVLPAFALFLLVFSFLYAVVTLAFWGQTPGMVAAGLVARSAGDQPLSFGQTGLRWLAGLLTVALAGLPLLLALTGRSLGDRLSGSATYALRRSTA